MKNNKQKTHMTKIEKRRLAFEKRNVKKEQNLARYGAEGGSALVMAKTIDLNRRVLAALLALVFVLTSVIVGFNLAGKAQGETDSEGYGMLETIDPDTGMVLRKGYKVTNDNETPDDETDDTFSLKLEAYATKDTTTKPLKDNTPLDIVMVLNQSSTMARDDVFAGTYNEITDTTTFSVDEATGKYIKVGDKYYEVKRRQGQYAYDSAGTGPWTVNGAGDGSHYYYNAEDDTYYLVKKGKGYLDYKKAHDAGTYLGNWLLGSSTSWSVGSWTKKNAGSYYVYDSGKDDAFYLIIREKGHTGLGSNNRYYEDEFFYLPNHTPKITSENASTYLDAPNLWTDSDALQAYNNNEHTTVTVNGSDLGTKMARINRGGALQTGDVQSNSQSLVKAVYTKERNYNDNHLYWDTDDSDHAIGRSIAISADEQVVSSDELFVKGDGYELYYEDDNGNPVPIWTHGVKTTTEPAYWGTLYTRDNITRLEAQKLAAKNYAEQLATQMGDRDYRIAVVGSAQNGYVYSGDKTVQGAFVTTTEDVENAIDALSSDALNGNALSDGLTKTADVFEANPLDSADARKRVVIVFGDKDTWEATSNDTITTRTADANLKDTYNSTVYTVGLFKNGSTSAEQFMRELSSEYFSTVHSPTVYKQMNGTYHYIANADVFPEDVASIISTFGTVATETANISSTEFVLNQATALLKDVIHRNFNLPTGDIDIKVAPATSFDDGVPTGWGTATTDSSIHHEWTGDGNRTLEVTGFDYDANYVSQSRPNGSGQKIIITIDGLTVNQRVKTESKSAKRIYFNTTDSAIYKDGAEELVVNKFPRPFLDDETMLAPAGGTGIMNNEGIVVNKYLSPAENGNYDLTVEAYTTQTSFSRTEKVPTDFVVVADQSGSMSEEDMPTGYKEVSGTKTLEQVRQGQYFVKGDDGNYYRVYGTRDYLYRYYPANYWYVGDLISRFGTRLGWFMSEDEAETNFENQMYFRELVDGKAYYQPITMTVKGVPLAYYIGFKYNSALTTNNPVKFNRDDTTYSTNGNSPWYRNVITGQVLKSGFLWSSSDAIVQGLYRDDNQYTYSKAGSITTGMYVNYPMYDRHVGYTKLAYRDVNGTEHFLKATTGQETFEFCNDDGVALTSQTGNQPTYSGLYEATGYQTRLEALQNALTEFAEAVAAEKNSDGSPVDNKIAIVGFSSPGFNNTELLTNENASINFNANWTSPSGSSSSQYSDNGKAHDGVQKATADNNVSYYKDALVSAYETNADSTTKVNQKVTDGIHALTAHGGTQPEDGLDMAYKILANRTEKTYTVQTDNTHPVIDRHTIVIYFTDGRPGDSTLSNQYSEANDVVNKAKAIKTLKNSEANNTYPSVFSIGVFGESDGNPLTYNETNLRAPYDDPAYWEYMGGYVETYQSGGSKYCLRRQWRPGNPEYTDIANDTIFDYMSVTSSNYPDAQNYIAPTWLSGTFNGNYVDATDGAEVRSKATALAANDYYRMASNQATLVAAFAQAVTMMNETISADQRLDAASVMQDVFNNTNFTVQDGYSIRATTVDGSMDKYGTVNFKEETEAPTSGVITKLEKVGENQTVTVTGFDYLANYINYGTTNADGSVALPKHDGKKLVVTISNVVPTETGDKFFSNISENNASSMYVKDNTVTGTDFPTPAISRHRYTLEVGDVNPNATFTVAMKVLDDSGNEVLNDANSLADVILVYPNGTRKLYSKVGPQEFLQVGNGQSFYLENLPTGYQVETNVISTDDAYKYYLTYDAETASDERLMAKGTPISTNFSYADHTIHIRSERGKKDVSVRERTIGSYGDTTHRFGEVITMEIPVIQGETLVTEFDCTFNEDFSGFENGLPKNADGYKAVFTVENPDATDVKAAKLTAIKYTESGQEKTWSLANDETPTDYELPMRDGDEITFVGIPTGNTVKAVQPEKNKYDHEVSYYYGQDDVSPSGIKLMTSNGDLLSGTHTLILKEVDGLETDRLEVKFVDGSITEIGGHAVDANTLIDLAKYETIFVIAADENDNLSDAKLNIDGTDVYFDTETQDDQTAYVATIKRQTNRPPVSVTVEKNNMDILIINERGDIEIEGIFDNHHSKVVYILAGFGALALAAGGYYVYRKKDEFINE